MKQRVLAPIALFILSLMLLIALSQLEFDWASWEPATCMPDDCFCERLRPPTAVRQPVNAWSSLAFTLVGLLVAFQPSPAGGGSAQNLMARPLYRGTYALSLAAVGLGSAFYHASLTLLGQFFDVAGMYLVTGFMLVAAWTRLFRLSARSASALFLAVNLAADLTLILIPETRRWVFALITLLALLFEFWYLRPARPRVEARWLLLALGAFGLAYLVWLLDRHRVLCRPDSLLQGHAFWHLAGAAAAWWLYRYYRSEGAER